MSIIGHSHDDRLLDALGDIDGNTFSGSVWRVVRDGRQVLDGSRGSGRWNPSHLSVLYTATEKAGALSEVHFHLSRGQSVFPTRIRHRIFELQVSTKSSLLLTDTGILTKLGVDMANYRQLLYERTQKIADAASFMGFDSIIAPSARHPSNVLVVLLANFAIEDLEIVSEEPVTWQDFRQG